jgi:hypothetical protein
VLFFQKLETRGGIIDPVDVDNPANLKILKSTLFIADTTKYHNIQITVAQKRLRI